MQIEELRLSHLKNSEHFQFHTRFRDLVEQHFIREDVSRAIETRFESYKALYEQEDEALKKIMKSALTVEVQNADKRRDVLFRGMVDANLAMLNHFKEDTQKAAYRLKILFDTYGNLVRKSLDEETADIYNLTKELDNAYAEDVKTVALGEWVTELKAANVAFEKQLVDRDHESGLKTDLVLRDVRKQIDEAYRELIDVVRAIIILDNAEACRGFVNDLNANIARYEVNLAKRKGLAEEGKDEEMGE